MSLLSIENAVKYHSQSDSCAQKLSKHYFSQATCVSHSVASPVLNRE